MNNVNPYILLCISILITLLYGLLRNLYSKKYVRGHADLYLLNTVSTVFSIVVIMALSAGISKPSLYTVGLGFLYGIATLGSTILILLALKIGPFSYTSVIVSSSMLIPALSGAIFWNESVSVWQYIGVGLIIVTLILSVDSKKGNKQASVKWLLCCLGAFVFSGAIGILQKAHQNSIHKEEINSFLLIAFLISAVFSTVFYFMNRKQPEQLEDEGKGKNRTIAFGVISVVTGICVAMANMFNMYLSGVIPSMFFFPVVNGANVILSALAGIVICKEKMSIKQWCGLCIGVVAILLLCM